MFWNNNRIILFIKRQTPAVLLIWLAAILIVYPDRDIFQIIFGVFFVQFWSYFVHRLGHEMPTDGIIGMFNTHWHFHHQPTKILPRGVELFIEGLTDVFLNFTLLIIQLVTGVMFVPFSIILLNAIIYTSIHIVNYSIIGSPTHKKHHLNHNTNFGPDTWDHIFSSSEDGEIEDLTHICFNTVVAFVVVLALKRHFGWID
jgi:hypothetical protein